MNTPVDAHRALLLEAGYALAHREDGWHECLASRDDERWVGRGIDEAAALADIVRQMFPSAAARHMLEAWLAAHASVPAIVEERATDPGSSVAVVPPTADPLPEEAVPAASSEPSLPAPSSEDPSEAVAEKAELGVSRDEALDSLADLSLTIEDARGDLARMTPDRQRLYVLGWICRARAYEEAFPRDAEVEQSVVAVARRLGELCRQNWPGTVRALQLYAAPSDAVTSARDPHAARIASWTEAAGYAERVLDEHLDAARAAGCDEDGWSDLKRLEPAPARASELLADVRAQIAMIIERDGYFPKRRPPALTEGEVAIVLTLARRLRWLRRATDDDEGWGEAAGRLRWLVPACDSVRDEIERLLSPGYAPSATWADIILGPEREALRRAKLVEVLARAPQVAGDADQLVSWLREALDVADNPRIAAVLYSARDDVVKAATVLLSGADRRLRRRVLDLTRRLEGMSEGEAARLKAEPLPKTSPTTTLLETNGAPHPDARAALIALVRPHTERRRAVLVSNRCDGELQQALETMLGLRITLAEASPRKVRAVCERIENRTYDLVLSATGFQSHATDGALARATRSADVPHVRVDRGRPLACVRALARQFGIAAG